MSDPTGWRIYLGNNQPSKRTLPKPPPWRRLGDRDNDAPPPEFVATDGLIQAVNAALYLRRPLLLTGPPGSGKSSAIESVAQELGLGEVLRWNVTSDSTREAALYQYEAIARLHDEQLAVGGLLGTLIRWVRGRATATKIGPYVRLGPLGTALASPTPRALLVDEIDKSNIDLPNDLLNVLEEGEFEIPELQRADEDSVWVRPSDDGELIEVKDGKVRCTGFPFVVLTSNGERDFPAPFLRRCIRHNMPRPSPDLLKKIVTVHLEENVTEAESELIDEFYELLKTKPKIATDQLLNAIFLVQGDPKPTGEEREALKKLLFKELTTDQV